MSEILDSGTRRKFETGAVRDITEEKGRCDLMPLDVVAEMLNDDVLRKIHYFQTDGNPAHLGEALGHFCSSRYKKDKYTLLLEVAKHYSEGCKKYGEDNWKKGIPLKSYVDSAVRHYLKWCRGDNDEPHDRAFCWNIISAGWTCEHLPELNDYAPKEAEQ
jgi:hypothetical protein